MNTENTFSPEPAGLNRVGRALTCTVAGLLALGFLFRAGQAGFRWMTHVSSPDINYKALTFWSAFYLLICGAIAFAVYPQPRPSKPQKAERGT